MIIQDDRKPEEKENYCYLVIGTDSFMSGWGGAKDGVSIAAWACKSEHRRLVTDWVESRSEMKRVRGSIDDGKKYRYRPSGKGHCHIYVVHDDHPAVARYCEHCKELTPIT